MPVKDVASVWSMCLLLQHIFQADMTLLPLGDWSSFGCWAVSNGRLAWYSRLAMAVHCGGRTYSFDGPVHQGQLGRVACKGIVSDTC